VADQIKITLPEHAHIHECRVIYGDTDSGGVVYYGNYLRYFEEGRTEYLREYGITYRALEDKGFILPVVECYSRYKAPARYDDLIVVRTAISKVKRLSCRFDYRIERKADKQILVKGCTVHAVINREGRLAQMPEDVFLILADLAKA
jgi:acyl-CoA thioester hydrolase